MTTIRILTEGDLKTRIGLDAASVACVEEAFAKLATDTVVMPPILSMTIPEHNGEVDVKTAYVPGLASFALKVSPGFFDNPKLGLPSLNGLMVVLSAETGLVEALLLDNGYLTDIRTAAAGAVAARHLARADAHSAAILGGGLQARLQLEALTLVRPIERAWLWARREEQAREAADELSAKLSIPVEATAGAEEAVKAADIVVTTTPATSPVLEAEWLRPGQHVTAMGSDNAHKNEIAPEALLRADLYVCDRLSQVRVLGELHHAIEQGLVSGEAEFPELGEVIAGARSGRTDDTQITLADLTGTGVQDTAIATLARERCEAAGIGAEFQA